MQLLWGLKKSKNRIIRRYMKATMFRIINLWIVAFAFFNNAIL